MSTTNHNVFMTLQPVFRLKRKEAYTPILDWETICSSAIIMRVQIVFFAVDFTSLVDRFVEESRGW